MKLFPVVATLLVVLAIVPMEASAATASCGTPTRVLVKDPEGLNLPLDKVPTPAPLYTQCSLQFMAYSGFTFSISGDLTGEMRVQFKDSQGAVQTYWYNVVLGEASLDREVTQPLTGGAIRMDVQVRSIDPVPLGTSGAIGAWRVSVDYA